MVGYLNLLFGIFQLEVAEGGGVFARSKQYYKFIQSEWLQGDPAQPPPPPERKWVRNKVGFPLLFFSLLPSTV